MQRIREQVRRRRLLDNPACVHDTHPVRDLGDHRQVGLLACCSIDEYDSGVIKKHEQTRRDKEDDRTRHMLALGAQPGPVLVTYQDSAPVDDILADVVEAPALLACASETGVRHEVWRMDDVLPDRKSVV